MRFYLFVVFLFASALFITSCQKELSPYEPQTGTDSTGVPIDTTDVPTDTTGVDSSSLNSYHPTTVGSFWKFKDTASGTLTTNSIGNSTKVINNIVFKEYTSSGNAPSVAGWLASPSPNYYLVAQGLSPNTGAPFDLTFYYLNDTASVGYSWDNNAGSGNGFTAYTTTSIVAKGLTMTVEGKTYTNVIQTHVDLTYDISGQISNNGGYDFFVAKGIGFIKIRALISLFGIPVTQTCSNLVDYQIK